MQYVEYETFYGSPAATETTSNIVIQPTRYGLTAEANFVFHFSCTADERRSRDSLNNDDNSSSISKQIPFQADEMSSNRPQLTVRKKV